MPGMKGWTVTAAKPARSSAGTSCPVSVAAAWRAGLSLGPEDLAMDMHIAQDRPLTGINVYALPPDEGEAVLRRQLAAAYRLVDHFGWTELIYGHLTARVPGDKPHFLINPFGLNYDEVTASNLVKIDHDGNNVGDSKHAGNYAGFVIHSAE